MIRCLLKCLRSLVLDTFTFFQGVTLNISFTFLCTLSHKVFNPFFSSNSSFWRTCIFHFLQAALDLASSVNILHPHKWLSHDLHSRIKWACRTWKITRNRSRITKRAAGFYLYCAVCFAKRSKHLFIGSKLKQNYIVYLTVLSLQCKIT